MIHNPDLEGGPFFWEGGPVGVFLSHGFTATTAEVRLLAGYLHERGYTVAGPLLPGHGTRPEDLNRVRWPDWVNAGEAVYQQLRARCQQVWVGGESAGALVALYLASEHPEAAGLLLYAPALKLTLRPLDVALLHLLAPFKPYVRKGEIGVPDRWQGYPVNPLKGTIQLLQLQKEIKKRLPRITQPILIVQGRLDTTVHPTAPEIIAQGVRSPVKAIHWLEHSVHTVIIDREWQQAAELTLHFIEQADKKET